MLRLISSPQNIDYFFPPSLKKAFQVFEKNIQNDTELLLFSDACHKAKGLPNGLALISPEDNTYLYPAILRDPGCGFSVFELTLNSSKNIAQLNQGLLAWKDFYEKQGANAALLTHLKAYCFGTKDWRKKEHMDKCAGPTVVNNEEVYLDNEEVQQLIADITLITNTLEIKKTHSTKFAPKLQGINHSNLIGVLHTGSDILPDLLADKFHPLISQHHQTKEMLKYSVHIGMGGVRLDSPLGQHYYQWLLFAMNYCLVKRYYMLESLADYLESENLGTINLLDDKTHAGAWKNPFNAQQWVQTRGIQHQSIGSKTFPYTYIAGHRETVSALVSSGPCAAEIHDLLCHGTGIQNFIGHTFSPNLMIEDIDINVLAKKCHYNTQPEYHLAEPYTRNLLTTLAHYQEKQYITDIFLLEPVINIQSNLYIKNTPHLRQV